MFKTVNNKSVYDYCNINRIDFRKTYRDEARKLKKYGTKEGKKGIDKKQSTETQTENSEMKT